MDAASDNLQSDETHLGFVFRSSNFGLCTYQQGQCINGELLLVLNREFLEVQFFTYDIISSAWRACNREATFKIWFHSEDRGSSFIEVCTARK